MTPSSIDYGQMTETKIEIRFVDCQMTNSKYETEKYEGKQEVNLLLAPLLVMRQVLEYRADACTIR